MLKKLVSKPLDLYLEKSSGILWTKEMYLQNFAAVLLYHYIDNKPVFKVFSMGQLADPNVMESFKS